MKKQKPTQNPHDKLFREVISNRENALELVQSTFPPTLTQLLDFSTFALENTSYINDSLKEHYSDVVYQCKLNEHKVKVCLLFEHKSYVVKHPHIQLLRYMLSAWEQQLKQKQPLQLVIPMIFYHHTAQWKVRPMYDYFGKIPSALHPFIPHLEYLLVKQVETCY